MIVGLGGGIGAARLWTGLAAFAPVSSLIFIVNTADDMTHRGLRICPDIDTTIYALAGVRDEARGWGLANESWRAAERLRQFDPDVWFNLGDLDLATHLYRSGLRAEGVPLSVITARLARAHGLEQTILPMSDGDVETWVTTASGAMMHYQDYLVRRRCAEPLAGVDLRGSRNAAPGVIAAIAEAEFIILAPSNPMASLWPILSMAGVRQALAASKAPKIAVTPTVSDAPIIDAGETNRAKSRAALLALQGLPHRAASIAGLYRGLIDAFVIDVRDSGERGEVEALGLQALTANTLIAERDRSVALARQLLAWRDSAEHRARAPATARCA